MAGEVIPAPVHDGRRLDWFPRFDPASLSYPMAAGPATELPTRGRLWTHGRVMDQGNEGACVGFGCAAEAIAEPVPVPGISARNARAWYRSAQRRDVWPGEAYDGTSVLAGCLEGRARGYYTGFVWAKRAEQLAAGIVDDGPAIIGVEWREGSYSTDELGVLRPSGDVVGGHCLCVIGFVCLDPEGPDRELWDALEELDLAEAAVAVLDGGEDGVFIVQNSWGPTFGKNGLCVVPLSVMRDWVRAGGEFAQPQGRQLSGARMLITQPEAQDAGGSTVTLHITAAELIDGDRVLDPPEELGQESVTVHGVRYTGGWGGRRVIVATRGGSFQLAAGAPVTVRRPQ
jgi:hypothetical protein